MHSNSISDSILKWYDDYGRHDLPWQQPNLYIRWVSEVMLQQTQVETAIPYFYRFTQKFPNVKTLAEASEDNVLHYWSGLGYYSRARNLHRAAKAIMKDFDGKLPKSTDEWQQLPGVGRSTAAAIIAQSLDTPTAILDANVKRVLARYFGIYGTNRESEEKLWCASNSILPDSRGADFAQAIMDIGATICKSRAPKCQSCPLVSGCFSYENAAHDELPSKKTKKTIPTREENWLYLYTGNQVLLEKNKNVNGVWQGLWRLPVYKAVPTVEDALRFGFDAYDEKRTATIHHRFSHYKLIATVYYWRITPKQMVRDNDQWLWYNQRNPQNIGLPKPIYSLLHP